MVMSIPQNYKIAVPVIPRIIPHIQITLPTQKKSNPTKIIYKVELTVTIAILSNFQKAKYNCKSCSEIFTKRFKSLVEE